MNETFIRIISLILGTAFLVLSFRLSRKKEHSLAPAVIIIAAVFFFGGLFHAGGLLKTATLEQFACWLVAGAFLVAAFRFLQTEKISLAFTVFILAAIFFFCSLSGVQSLLKTGMLWTVSERLTKYGEKIDNFQLAMAEMKNQLSDQQNQIETNQVNNQIKIEMAQSAIAKQQASVNSQQIIIQEQEASITNQYQKISAVQSELAIAQTNLSAQSAKIQDVEFLVENLFKKTFEERLAGSDSNAVSIVEVHDGLQLIVVKMKHVPVQNSVHGIFQDGQMQIPLLPFSGNHKNTVATYWQGGNVKGGTISLQYVIDARETNLIKNIEVRGNQIFMDGVFFWEAPSTNGIGK